MSESKQSKGFIWYLTRSAAVVAAVGTIFGAYSALDSKYAKASDVADVKRQLKEAVTELRIVDLEDKIFMLELKVNQGTATPIDIALLNRYKRQLDSLTGNRNIKTRGILR